MDGGLRGEDSANGGHCAPMPHGALEELPTALCAEMGLLSPITKIGERVNKHSNLLCIQSSPGRTLALCAALGLPAPDLLGLPAPDASLRRMS